MRVLVDADACPVVDIACDCARRAGAGCILFTDDSHVMCRPDAETVTVETGRDSADYAVVGRAQAGDIVVTQDYGLAALCLAKGARAIHQDGWEYTGDNINSLLFSRYASAKARRAGERLRGPKKRREEQNAAFREGLRRMLDEVGAET